MMGTWYVPLPSTISYSKLITADEPNCHWTELLESTLHW
jgi:hypothetical protein